MDVIARPPNCAGQAAGAVSAKTQVKMGRCTDVIEKFPNRTVPDIRMRLPKPQMAKIMVQYGRPSRSSRKGKSTLPH